MDSSGYIYVLKDAQEMKSGKYRYKIGYTKNPSRRLKELISGYYCDPASYFVLLVKVPHAKEEETHWHDIFYDKRIIKVQRDEWFKLDIEDIQDMYTFYSWIFRYYDKWT